MGPALPEFGDLVQVLQGFRDGPPDRGILLVDQRLRESFHSYPELMGRIQVLGNRFLSQGVRPGQKVLIALPTEIAPICSFLALLYIGAVPVSVSSPLLGQDREAHRRQILKLLTSHRIDRLVASKDFAGVAGSSRKVPLEMEVKAGEVSEEELRDPPALEPAEVSPDDIAFVQFSSGSTSDPKGVPITHRNLVYNLVVQVENDRRTEESVTVSWLPLYHDMGLVMNFLPNFLLRNHQVLMHPLCFVARPVNWLDYISRHGGTTTAVPNFALDQCIERVTDEQLAERDIDLGTFQYIYNGSEPVRAETIRRFESRFCKHGFVPCSIHPAYGMAEATVVISATDYHSEMVTRRINDVEVPSVGPPLGDFRVRIRDDDGNDLGTDTEGEIWISGTSVMQGYLTAGGRVDDSVRDGWLATGDLGLVDDEGRLYISGRKKDLIIYQGKNFYGHDIVSRIEDLSYVKRGKVFVFEMATERGGEVIVMTAPPKRGAAGAGRLIRRLDAAVEAGGLKAAVARPLRSLLRLRGGTEAPRDLPAFEMAIRKFVLREFGLPVHDVHLIPKIPKTTSGKPARHLCEKIYRDALAEGRSAGGR